MVYSKEIYIILCDNNNVISSVCYDKIEEAIKFIENRTGRPQRMKNEIMTWREDGQEGNYPYKIKTLTLRKYI